MSCLRCFDFFEQQHIIFQIRIYFKKLQCIQIQVADKVYVYTILRCDMAGIFEYRLKYLFFFMH